MYSVLVLCELVVWSLYVSFCEMIVLNAELNPVWKL